MPVFATPIPLREPINLDTAPLNSITEQSSLSLRGQRHDTGHGPVESLLRRMCVLASPFHGADLDLDPGLIGPGWW